jgi:hypothetical protein
MSVIACQLMTSPLVRHWQAAALRRPNGAASGPVDRLSLDRTAALGIVHLSNAAETPEDAR